MTNETRQRIEYFTRLLPGMKEKVMATTTMFVMALVVMVTATYAWITLSSAPEVTSVDTVVAANGSLEIALANGTGSAPGKSAEGDSTGAGNPINAANITWGNLVNLSDASYGLSKITLRPAALNGTSGLLSNPLYGVGYGTDGRIDTMVTDDDFAYVYYDTKSGEFLVDESNSHLGVRAVSTFYYGTAGADNLFSELYGYAKGSHSLAKVNYKAMTNENQEPGTSYISALEGLIQVYAQFIIDKRGDSTLTYDDLDVTEYVPDLYNMMTYFQEKVVVPAGQSYLEMANMLDLLNGNGGDTGYDLDSLVAASKGKTIESYISSNIPSLYQYALDYTNLSIYLLDSATGDFTDLSDSQKANSLAYWAYVAEGGGYVSWSNISSMVDWICDIDTATLDGYYLYELSSAKKAYSIISSDKTHSAVLANGAIQRMEQRIGEKMSCSISVNVDASEIVESYMSGMGWMFDDVTIDAVLTTTAKDPYEMDTDIETVKGLDTGSYQGSDPIAEDTYAMAIDLWLRTNAGSSSIETETNTTTTTNSDGSETTTTTVKNPEKAYLTLEGTVITSEQTVEASITDANGDEQPAYIAKYTVDGTEYTREVFLRYGVYYYIDSTSEVEYEFEPLLEEELGTLPEISYTRKMVVEEVIVGYDGVNRIWTEDQLSGFSDEGTSTTQGRGSCYIFYANTPADQSRFLELLGAMKVVFINENGRQIGLATMDTENYFAQNGKVTVPLVLDKSIALNLGTDLQGNTIYGLTSLDKNVATRVTALVYLDGSRLTNEMVLASGDIQGNLNIQFGCSTAVATTTVVTTGDETNTSVTYSQGTNSLAIDNDALMDDYITVSASADPVKFDYNPDNPASSTLNVKVTGVEPDSVTARFVRAISSTQGVQQDSISLSGEGSDWSSVLTFNKPGNYVLRSVWVDGVEYDLDEPVNITVTGSSVNSLSCDALPAGSRSTTIMTAEGSFSTNMTLGFTTSAQIPNSVTGIFMDEEGRQVNVAFSLEGGEWKGTATFTTSGTFTMDYVEIDGDIYELSDSLKPTLEIMLGLKVRTWVTASQETLSKLQQIYDGALATNFVLDTSAKDEATGELLFSDKTVTLLVSAEIYDNNGNEITGLGNVKLYYGRAGSSVLDRGLDSDISWDATSGRYTGAFAVDEAGTFNFSQVKVITGSTTNIITSYTSAPSIQAMPPDDAYYFNNYTDTYQYAPNMDAKMTLGIAYSSAASKIKATVTNGNSVMEVEGTMGLEAEDQGDKSVNLWNFTIPTVNDVQEGEWKLTDITMYGVYYDGVYYSGDGNGIKVDLTAENIQSKVVNNLYVTLSGTSTKFESTDTDVSEFMEDHKVSDMTVAIADYAGKAIEGADISNLKVVYYLDSSAISNGEYGYTSTNMGSVKLTGDGSLADGSETVYNVSTMNFQYAGPYKLQNVSFDLTIDGAKAQTSNIVRYMDGGVLSDKAPTYEVVWEAPTITITGTNPTGGTKDNPSGGTDISLHTSGDTNGYGSSVYGATTVKNYYEDYYANLYIDSYCNYWNTTYTAPIVTFSLVNGGNISSTNKATLTIPNEKGTTYNNTATFTSDDSSVDCTVGYVDGETWYNVGTQKISSISIAYGSDIFDVKLSESITIKQTKNVPTTLTYVIPDAYSELFTAPDAYTNYTGKTAYAIASDLSSVTDGVDKENDIVEGAKTNSSSKVCYYTTASASWGRTKYTYYIYNRTTTKWTQTSSVDTYNVEYVLKGWLVGGKQYDIGTNIPVSSNVVATAVIEEIWPEKPSSTTTKSRTATTVVDVSAGEPTSTTGYWAEIPSGYSDVGKDNIHTTAYTTYTDWQ